MKTLVILSDLHSNSTVGLAKPTIQLDDGDQVSASTVRRWLWHSYLDILEQVQKKYNGDIYGVINGDAVELDDKNRSIQLITHNRQEAIKIACETLEPFFDLCKSVYVMRGTEAHTGQNAQGEEAIGANFDNTMRNPETGAASWWWLPLELDGVRLDIAHHPKGGGSGRPYLKQSGINQMASDAVFNYANEGLAPPHLVIRSHLHGYRDSHEAFRTRAIITPPMSMLTSYGYRIGITASNDIGALVIFCDKGWYHVEPLLYPVAKTEAQVIE